MQKTVCFSLLLLPLAFALPAKAENTGGAATPEAVGEGAGGNWTQDQVERQDFREEMEKIRAEHEAIENARDQIKVRCLNAKGQDHAACQQKWHELHQRREALHQRLMALHERMNAEHLGRHEEEKQAGGNQGEQPSTAAK